MKTEPGNLILIPIPIADDALHSVPPNVLQWIEKLDYFIAERARTARRAIKELVPSKSIQDCIVEEIPGSPTREQKQDFLKRILDGKDCGLMSEAGCPAVADPGHQIVASAHFAGIRVIPLVGPSSIMLALMASGMNGQKFSFKGYLPAKKTLIGKALRDLERLAETTQETQIFIEAPYRNTQVITEALKVLKAHTMICVAADLTSEDEWIFSGSVQDWRKKRIPDFHKRPCIFLIGV